MTESLNSHDAFIAALVGRLSQGPSTSFNSHCFSERALYQLFEDIFAQGHRPYSSKEKTKEWLVAIRLLTPIRIDEYPGRPTRSTKFYQMDVSRAAHPEPTPLELLQAYDPAGVVCYFSAIVFHSLTTQPPSHHHVAVPTEPRVKEVAASLRPKLPGVSPQKKKADPLGTWLFTYRGIRYYQTSREQRLIPGVQTRFLGPTAIIRITTLEQTLLDTLHRPLSCGGPAVVMEAWEQGVRRASEEKLARYLHEMNYLPIAQRLGYILQHLGHQPAAALKGVLDDYLAELNPSDPSMYQQLFPGLQYDHPELPWLVYGPA